MPERRNSWLTNTGKYIKEKGTEIKTTNNSTTSNTSRSNTTSQSLNLINNLSAAAAAAVIASSDDESEDNYLIREPVKKKAKMGVPLFPIKSKH